MPVHADKAWSGNRRWVDCSTLVNIPCMTLEPCFRDLQSPCGAKALSWCESTLLRRFAQRGPSGSFEGFNANLGVFEKFGFWRIVFSIDHALCKTLVDLFTFFLVRKHSPPEIRSEGPFGVVSKVSTQIWAFLKNLSLEESSSHRPHSAKHSSIYLLSSSWKCAHFLRRPKFRATDWTLFETKVSKTFMSIKKCVCANFEDKNMNFERFWCRTMRLVNSSKKQSF